MSDRRAIHSLLKDRLPNYDKQVEYATYEEGYPDAVERARKLDELAESINDPGRNPTTRVYHLTERIRGSGHE